MSYVGKHARVGETGGRGVGDRQNLAGRGGGGGIQSDRHPSGCDALGAAFPSSNRLVYDRVRLGRPAARQLAQPVQPSQAHPAQPQDCGRTRRPRRRQGEDACGGSAEHCGPCRRPGHAAGRQLRHGQECTSAAPRPAPPGLQLL